MNLKNATFLRAVINAKQAPQPPRPAIAFMGRSNVGKSSLINSLVGKKGLARTSSTPGRTQEIVFFDIDGVCHFVDLPGYGYAKVPEAVRAKWGPMIEKFIRAHDDLRLLIVILDARREPSPEDLQLIEWLASLGREFLFVVTKCDKLKTAELARNLRTIGAAVEPIAGERKLIAYSSETGAGRSELIREILSVVK